MKMMVRNFILSCLTFLLMSSSAVSFAADRVSLSEFLPRYAVTVSGSDLPGLVELTKVRKLNMRMTQKQMSEYIGSSLSQTKMIYGFFKSDDGLMTPLEFVHFLSDDLFNRRALQMFVKEKEKSMLRHRMKVMDFSNAGKKMTAKEISDLLTGFDISDVSEATISKFIQSF